MNFDKQALERQKELKEAGFYFGKLDGLFGAKSKQAERLYLESVGELIQPTMMGEKGEEPKKAMTLREHRCAFTLDISKLIIFANEKGYETAYEDIKSNEKCGIHMPNSQHYKGLAGDVSLYKQGKYQRLTQQHKELGEYWESLSPHNRWGGRYSDGNHYERLEHLWRANNNKASSKPKKK